MKQAAPNIQFEYKSLVAITFVGYLGNVLGAAVGITFPEVSYQQLLCFQIGDAFAIMASVIAARYTGLRGQHVAASAFILLGITHGLSLASSGLDSFNVEKGITIIMPMIPSLFLLYWCTIFPAWLRLSGLVPIILFIYVYLHVMNGGVYYDTPVRAAYASWMILELMWSYYIYKDWKNSASAG